MTTTIHYNWVQFNSHENQFFDHDVDEEETLSLSDLPAAGDPQTTPNSINQDSDPGDFEFRSGLSATVSRSPETMCNADDVFFQGQILPLPLPLQPLELQPLELQLPHRKINSDDGDEPGRANGYQFHSHSHPSPSPQIRTRSFRTLSYSNYSNYSNYSKPKSSSLWSFLQVGLVKQQEIGLSDLKNRSKRFGSHNSNSSSASSSMNSSNDQNPNSNQNQNLNRNQNQNQKRVNCQRKKKTKKKKKQRLFMGGCDCSVDSVERTIKELGPRNKTGNELRNSPARKESAVIGDGKQGRNRTFEWLKQLSVSATS